MDGGNRMKCIDQSSGDNWTLYNGDCCEVLQGLPDNSVGFSVYSPPFASLYTYSNSDRDMGNCADYGEFMDHYSFLCRELMRVMKPGRLVAVHCMLLPTSKQHHGYIGLQDFRGDLIRCHQKEGFIFHSEVVIWKDPVTAMQRTKAIGLLWKQIKKDSCMSRQGVPDYVIVLRKPGENEIEDRVSHTAEEFPVALWQKYASPVWMDVSPSNTLQKLAKDENDERHICPLQLDVIARCVKLWSNRGDIVLSPFAGIGSEGYQSLIMGRRFVGVELKPSYYEQAAKNLRKADAKNEQLSLFAKSSAVNA
jgi:DNA modification methylase